MRSCPDHRRGATAPQAKCQDGREDDDCTTGHGCRAEACGKSGAGQLDEEGGGRRREIFRGGHRPADGLPCLRQRLRRDRRRVVGLERPTVDGGREASNHTDAQGHAQLAAGLREGRGLASAIRWRRTHDVVGDEGRGRAGARHQEREPENHAGERQGVHGASHQEDPGGRDEERAAQHPMRLPTARGARCEKRSSNARDGRGEHPHPRLKRGKADARLKVLTREEEGGARSGYGRELNEEGNSKRPVPKQREVEHGIREAPLSPHEEGSGPQAEGEARGARNEFLRCQALRRVDESQNREKAEDCAEQIDGAPLDRSVLGEQKGCRAEQQGRDGQIDEEDGAPREVLQQEASEEGADRRSCHERAAPDGDRSGALRLVGEEAADQREGRGHQGRGRQSQRAARCDQPPARRCQTRQKRRGSERGGSPEEEAAASDAVPERTGGHEKRSDREAVDVDDPEKLVGGRQEIRRQLGHRQVKHGHVDGDQEGGQGEDGQADPGTSPRRVSWMHSSLLLPDGAQLTLLRYKFKLT